MKYFKGQLRVLGGKVWLGVQISLQSKKGIVMDTFLLLSHKLVLIPNSQHPKSAQLAFYSDYLTHFSLHFLEYSCCLSP